MLPSSLLVVEGDRAEVGSATAGAAVTSAAAEGTVTETAEELDSDGDCTAVEEGSVAVLVEGGERTAGGEVGLLAEAASSFLWKSDERKLFLRGGGVVRLSESVDDWDDSEDADDTRSASGGVLLLLDMAGVQADRCEAKSTLSTAASASANAPLSSL